MIPNGMQLNITDTSQWLMIDTTIWPDRSWESLAVTAAVIRFLSCRLESWKVNVSVIVAEAPHGWRTPSGRDWLYPTELHSSCVWGLHHLTPGDHQTVIAPRQTFLIETQDSVQVYYNPTVRPTSQGCSLIKRDKSEKFLFLLSESFLRNVKWSVTNWSISGTNQWCRCMDSGPRKSYLRWDTDWSKQITGCQSKLPGQCSLTQSYQSRNKITATDQQFNSPVQTDEFRNLYSPIEMVQCKNVHINILWRVWVNVQQNDKLIKNNTNGVRPTDKLKDLLFSTQNI